MEQLPISDLTVRKLPFDFTEIPFLWSPSKPTWSLQMNAFSFIVLGFERYIIKAFTEVESLLSDDKVRAEAVAMKEQEAQHSLGHRRHVKALIDRYPELQSTVAKVFKSYDDLYNKEDLKFHLSYIANIEGLTPAVGIYLIENRTSLFAEGDARIGSMVLWHFIEELEHRNSAKIVYDAVVPNPWYRLTTAFRSIAHIFYCVNLICDDLLRIVPLEDREPAGYSPEKGVANQKAVAKHLSNLLTVSSLKAGLSSLTSLSPYHNPAKIKMPRWVDQWYRSEQLGEDMTVYYGIKPKQQNWSINTSSQV